jgi:hypothetical protein
LAELHLGYIRKDIATDGIVKDGKSIKVSLIFTREDDRDRFQSAVIDLMSVVTGKRPLIEVDDASAPREIILQSQQSERIAISSAARLVRVFNYQYEHDRTTREDGIGADSDYDSDAVSEEAAFDKTANVADPEVRFQMIEDPSSEYWASMDPEVVRIKDWASCTRQERSDPNNFLYMVHFLHCYFDGLNAQPPRFPVMKIQYVDHDAEMVACSTIDAECPLGLPPRHRARVRVIFQDANKQKYAIPLLREGGRHIDALTYEMHMYFIGADKAAAFLNWKEDQTERAWAARRAGVSAAQFLAAERIGHGSHDECK